MVLVLVPMANAASMHDCCNEDTQNAGTAIAGTTQMHALMGHSMMPTAKSKTSHDNHMPDGRCDAACCGIFVAFNLADQPRVIRPSGPVLVRSYALQYQLDSVSLGNITPPPRFF